MLNPGCSSTGSVRRAASSEALLPSPELQAPSPIHLHEPDGPSVEIPRIARVERTCCLFRALFDPS